MKKVNLENVSLKMVQTNVRISSDDKPYIRLSETPGKFTLNSLACRLLDVTSGDTISLFENGDAETIDEQFMICKGVGENVAKLFSPKGAKGSTSSVSFTQAGTYSRLVQLDINAVELSPEMLEEKGIFVSRPSETYPDRKNYSSSVSIRFELEEAGAITVGEGEDAKEVTLYLLTNSKVNSKQDEE